jgi:hypothetical protein
MENIGFCIPFVLLVFPFMFAAWIQKPVSFCENQKNQSGLVLSAYRKPTGSI